MENKSLLIIGAGGHAKVVLSTALANSENIIGFLDDKTFNLTNQFQGYPLLGHIDALQSQNFPSAVFGIGKNAVRKELVTRYHFFKDWKTLIHPSAYVHPSAKIGPGTVVFAGAIIQPDAEIGAHCIINTGATIDHDCKIADYVHLAPGVHLAGGVKIGEGAFLGIGSVVIQEINIGQWSLIAAGGVVINDIMPNQTVMGVPAKEWS